MNESLQLLDEMLPSNLEFFVDRLEPDMIILQIDFLLLID